jgi:hypothetical protein
MVRIAVRNVRSDFEEFVNENTDAGEDDYDFASAGQGIMSGQNRARRNVNFRGMGTYEDMDRDLNTIKLKNPKTIKTPRNQLKLHIQSIGGEIASYVKFILFA